MKKNILIASSITAGIAGAAAVIYFMRRKKPMIQEGSGSTPATRSHHRTNVFAHAKETAKHVVM